MIAERIEAAKQVDWWPFIRLLITAAVLGLAAHAFVGWQPRPRELIALSGQMVGVLAILAMISFALADLYLLAFLLVPLYVLAVLNDWTYSASFWAGRTILRLRSQRSLAMAGLCGEIAIFALCLFALGRLAARF